MSVPLPIGRAAALVGIPTWRIREWEEKGYISPARKPSGHRVFGEAEMRRLVELRDLLLEPPQNRAEFTAELPIDGRAKQAGHLAPGAHTEESGGGDPLLETHRSTRRSPDLGAAAIRLANASGGFDGLRPALEFALDTALELTDARIGTVSYADLTRQRYVLAAHRGLSMGYVRGIETWQLDEGLAGRAYSMREPVFIEDLAKDPVVPRSIVHEEGLRSYICVPILRGGRRLGIIEVFSKARSIFTIDDIRSVEIVGAAISPTLESSRLVDELEFFRAQRDNISRHWMTQLSRAVEEFQSRTTSAILSLAEDIGARTEIAPGVMQQELQSLAAGLAKTHLMTVNLRDTISSHIVEGETYLLGRQLDLEVSESDINVEHGFAGKILELLESLISQVAHSAQERVSVRVEVRDAIEIEVHDDIERPNRTDFVQSFSAACTRLLKSLDGESRSPITGYGTSAVWVSVPLTDTDQAVQQLTLREREILQLLSRGLTNRELAHELFISPKTLQNHLTAIYRKLGVKNRTEAIAVSGLYA